MSAYLSPAELVELTDAHSRKLQIKWLQDNGFTFVVSTKGAIKVLRAHRDARLGAVAANDMHAGPEPDFSVFRKSG